MCLWREELRLSKIKGAKCKLVWLYQLFRSLGSPRGAWTPSPLNVTLRDMLCSLYTWTIESLCMSFSLSLFLSLSHPSLSVSLYMFVEDQCHGEQGCPQRWLREHWELPQHSLPVLQYWKHPRHERKPAEADGRQVPILACSVRRERHHLCMWCMYRISSDKVLPQIGWPCLVSGGVFSEISNRDQVSNWH